MFGSGIRVSWIATIFAIRLSWFVCRVVLCLRWFVSRTAVLPLSITAVFLLPLFARDDAPLLVILCVLGVRSVVAGVLALCHDIDLTLFNIIMGNILLFLPLSICNLIN